MLSRVFVRAVSARRLPSTCRRAVAGFRPLSDNAVTKRDEEDKAELKVYTTEEKVKRQREMTVTSPLNRDVFIPDDQLPAIEDGEEGILAGSRDYKAYEGRLATIAKPPQHAMTSGTYKFRHWRVTFDHQETWTNHLMGMCPCSCSRTDCSCSRTALHHL